MRIFENVNFEFIAKRRIAYIISGVLIGVSIVSFVVNGLELGIDFKGGMEFVIETSEPLDAVAVRSSLSGVLPTDPEVKTFDQDALLIRTLQEADINVTQGLILTGIRAAFDGVELSVVKTDNVGPRFAQDLKMGAIYSVFGALLVIFVYILIRFEWRFGVGAVTALFHDVIITLGVFSLVAFLAPDRPDDHCCLPDHRRLFAERYGSRIRQDSRVHGPVQSGKI